MIKKLLLLFVALFVGSAFFAALWEDSKAFAILFVIAVAGLFFVVRKARVKKRREKQAAEAYYSQGVYDSDDWPQPDARVLEEPEEVDYPFVNCGIAQAFSPVDFIVFDTETTGFSPRDDKIIELAALKVQNGEMTRFHSLINPGRRIPKRSREIHGITDADVAAAPTFRQILPALDAFLDPSLPIVGQNILFDLRMLWWEYHDAGQDIAPRRFINTYQLAKKAFPGRSSYALASLIRDYGLIEGEQTHRAESDVDATLALYNLCRERLKK